MARKKNSPVREYTIKVDENTGATYVNRIAIGTPATGLVRVEWTQARYGQVIPTNWSQVQVMEYINGYYPLKYQVADAQNLIVNRAIHNDFEWLLLWEHDVMPPQDALIRLNKYIIDEEVPVVSGLYYTRSIPSEPLIYRGRGTGAFYDFKQGDLVWASGVPTGFLLVHMGIIRLMWEDSSEYRIKDQIVRRVFETPRKASYDPVNNLYSTFSGTSDLHWCNRVIEGKYLKRAGWDKYQRKKYPFLVDTNMFCIHINPDGTKFPPGAEMQLV